MARAHVGARGHRLDGVLAGDVLEHEALNLAQRLAPGRLRGERRAELRLVSGAAQEHHELAGDGEGQVAIEVLLDERESQVHAGGDARRGPHAAIADEDRLRVHGTSGFSRCSRAAHDQCVVARLPESRPARASRKAPVHTDAVRRALRAEAAIHRTVSGSSAARCCPDPPATISVCSGAGASASAAWGTSVRPLVV